MVFFCSLFWDPKFQGGGGGLKPSQSLFKSKANISSTHIVTFLFPPVDAESERRDSTAEGTAFDAQGHREVWKSGGRAISCVVDIICPIVKIELIHLPKSEVRGGGIGWHPCPWHPPMLLKNLPLGDTYSAGKFGSNSSERQSKIAQHWCPSNRLLQDKRRREEKLSALACYKSDCMLGHPCPACHWLFLSLFSCSVSSLCNSCVKVYLWLKWSKAGNKLPWSKVARC